MPLHSPYGIVEIDDKNLAVEFREKPILPYWVNAGIYLVNGSMFSLTEASSNARFQVASATFL